MNETVLFHKHGYSVAQVSINTIANCVVVFRDGYRPRIYRKVSQASQLRLKRLP